MYHIKTLFQNYCSEAVFIVQDICYWNRKMNKKKLRKHIHFLLWSRLNRSQKLLVFIIGIILIIIENNLFYCT